MYLPKTRFEVKLKITLTNGEIIEPGTQGTIEGSVTKMVGKSYQVSLDDGRNLEIHMVIMNNQTKVIKD